MPAIRRRWTTTEVRALTDESRAWPRYELIDGELLVTPAPGWTHQFVASELFVLLNAFCEAQRVGVAVMSPSDLELKPGTITQPDVFVVPAGMHTGPHRAEWSDIKSLLLAVEVLSPSSRKTDRVTKRQFYLDHGVAEYWIVDSDARQVERWTPGQMQAEVDRDLLTWTPRQGSTLVIDWPALFARVDAKWQLING